MPQGKTSGTRTDMNINRIPDQTYGAQAEQVAVQRAAQQAAPRGGPPAAGQGPAVPPPSPFGPTRRPHEPITAGLPFGPGDPGVQLPDDNLDEVLRAAFRLLPNDHLRRLVERRVRG